MQNVALLQRAAKRDFFTKSLLHFCKFLVNPNFHLKLAKPSESQGKDVSDDILFVQKYGSINFST